jgi:hypothetical protein
MVIATSILILAGAMFFFYLQETCRRILRKRFDRAYFAPIVKANRLEFLLVRKAIQESKAPLEYSHFPMMLRCDYLALRYLLKNLGNEKRRYSREDWILMAYFRLTAFSLSLRHRLHLDERKPMLRMTFILEYFGNVIGWRVNRAKLGDLSAFAPEVA